MAIRVENNENDIQAAHSTFTQNTEKSHSSGETRKGGHFENVLSSLKPRTGSTGESAGSRSAHGSLFDRPATSQINRSAVAKGNHEKHPGSLGHQDTNNLATSALIKLSAMSPGGSRLGKGFPHMSPLTAPGLSSPSLPGQSGVAPVQSFDGRSLDKIGDLSAKFESGDKGPAAIGYDSKGGTSYGTYQISSRAGTMKHFLEYLQDRAPELANKLRAAGPANTGGRNGRMPEAWKKISAEEPERFAGIQANFIEETHYRPALEEISERTGIDMSRQPRAVQEVLWSTAVQHGSKGAANIFCRAAARSEKAGAEAAPEALIRNVYNLRAGQFGSSTSETRASVRNRFMEEKMMAIAMLSGRNTESSLA